MSHSPRTEAPPPSTELQVQSSHPEPPVPEVAGTHPEPPVPDVAGRLGKGVSAGANADD